MKVMMSTDVFFADTYALIEIIGGTAHYKPYTECILVTTSWNLAELYYSLLRDYGQAIAEKYLRVYEAVVIPITLTSIREGMKLKLRHQKERLSYTDCVGYALALEKGIPFLTGDEKFESKENVEFVK